MIVSVILMILFVIPVFTGQVVNIGNVTGFACGLFLYFITKDPQLLSQFRAKALLGILIICLLIAIPLTYNMFKAVRRKAKGDETLIILGCEIMGEKPSLMQVERLEAAYQFLSANPSANVVCSGGQGKNEKVSEAYAMKRWLTERGIEETRIFMEDCSETTQENIRFSKRIIQAENLNPDVAVCTNEFHLYRAFLIAEKEGLSCTSVSAPTAWWLFATFYVRELYAILYFLLKTKRKD